MSKNKKIIYIGIILVILFAISQSKTTTLIHGEWDISKEVEQQGYSKYLVEAVDFDYTHPDVLDLAKNIKSSTSTPEEAVKDTIRYVVQNVRYDSDVDIGYCYEEKASTVLEVKTGDCVSMVRLVTALLRAQGIPTRTMGGCLTSKRCAPIFAVVPLKEPQVTPMTEGDFKKRGFLHEWVEFWLPNEGWRIIEATSGQVFPLDCATYLEFGYDSNKYDRCIISDTDFWNLCKGA